MVKKISVLALAGLFALPALSAASGGPNVQDLERKIEELSRQLDELKAAMGEQAEMNKATAEKLDDMDFEILEEIEEKMDDWDLAARFKLNGDFRSRLDMYNADTVFGRSLQNDSLWTNRFRLNMRVKATENVEFKGRLAMYIRPGECSPLLPMIQEPCGLFLTAMSAELPTDSSNLLC